jgi:hypothetical protein
VRHALLQVAAALALVFGAAMRRAERRIVRRLRHAGAASADRAVALGTLRPFGRVRLRRLLRAGAVHEAGTARYYLDERGFAAYRRARWRRAAVIMAIGLASVLGIYFWQARR